MVHWNGRLEPEVRRDKVGSVGHHHPHYPSDSSALLRHKHVMTVEDKNCDA